MPTLKKTSWDGSSLGRTMPNYLLVQMLDVGQGDSTIVQIQNGKAAPYRMMMDCGSVKGSVSVHKITFDAIRNALNVTSPGTIAFDDLMISHADEDHYNLLKFLMKGNGINKVVFNQLTYGCTPDLYANSRPGENNWTMDYILNASTKKSAIQAQLDKVNAFHAPACIPLSNWVNLWVLSANAAGKMYVNQQKQTVANKDKTNENSIVLLLECEGHKIFLMGDATEYTEERILDNYKGMPNLFKKAPKKLCFLKAGHHGSNTSSGKAWLAAIQPDMVMISSDTRHFGTNGRGIPDEDKVNQLSKGLSQLPAGGKFLHSIVYFDTKAADFQTRDVGNLALCTSIFDTIRTINPKTQEIDIDGEGCSWMIWIEQTTGLVYYGWSGNVHDPLEGLANGTVVLLNPGEGALA